MLVIGNSSVLSILTDSAEAAVITVKNAGVDDITPILDITVEELNGADIPRTTAFDYTSINASVGSTSFPGLIFRWEPGLMVQDQEETIDFDLTIVDITLVAHQFRVVAVNTTPNTNLTNDTTFRNFDVIKCSDLLTCDLITTSTKSYTYVSPGGGSGAFYAGGFYEAPLADANLTQASLTVTMGSADNSYAAHAFIVAADIGTASGGSGAVTIEVSGTSITDAGVRATSDTEIIVADITALSTDDYLETTKKWLGEVTFTIDEGATGHTAYALDFNYGLARYENLGDRDYTIIAVDVIGLAGASDTSFDVEVYHHITTGWTYSAAAFEPGSTVLWSMNTDHGTEQNLVSGEHFSWKRDGLSQIITGSSGTEGV